MAYVQAEVPQYQAKLEAYPDGMRDPEKEQARAERRRLRKEQWDGERKAKTDSRQAALAPEGVAD